MSYGGSKYNTYFYFILFLYILTYGGVDTFFLLKKWWVDTYLIVKILGDIFGTVDELVPDSKSANST